MSTQVVSGALMKCSFGVAPSALTVIPTSMVNGVNMPAATVMDFAPMANIKPFGMCSSLSNPTVASATSAALGVLTPMPCIPATSGPWKPGSTTVKIGKQAALTKSSTCQCAYGGVITINSSGQGTVKTN